MVDAESVIATHLTELVKRFAPDLLSRQDTQNLLENMRADYPALVEDLVPTTLTVGEVQEVLQNLLSERVSIRDLVTICETLATHARDDARHRPADGVRAGRAWRGRSAPVRRRARHAPRGNGRHPHGGRDRERPSSNRAREAAWRMPPWQVQRLLGVVSTEIERMASTGRDPMILCSSRIRLALRRLIERQLPNVTVLAFSEVTTQTTVEAVGNIEVSVADETLHR